MSRFEKEVRRRVSKSTFAYEKLAPRKMLAVSWSHSELVADYGDDFNGPSPADGWAYLWNAPDGWSSTQNGDK